MEASSHSSELLPDLGGETGARLYCWLTSPECYVKDGFVDPSSTSIELNNDLVKHWIVGHTVLW